MYPLVSEELEKMDNNPEYDTYYSSMENITEPVGEEDVYYEVTGERHSAEVGRIIVLR